jgi:MATE family, multidrug and toxin extrusion protein
MFGRVAAAEGFFIYRADWDQAVEDAQDRNAAG